MQQCYDQNENQKNPNYNERIVSVDNGSFTPLVFSLHGGMSREYMTFYDRPWHMIAERKKNPRSITASWIRIKICFTFHASFLRVRGSCSIFKSVVEIGNDTILDQQNSKI